MSVPVIAVFAVQESQQAQAVEVIQRHSALVHAETGCLLYAVHTSGRRSVVLIEKWADIESLKAHGSGSALAGLTRELSDIGVDEPQVQVLRPAPAGDSDKGAI